VFCGRSRRWQPIQTAEERVLGGKAPKIRTYRLKYLTGLSGNLNVKPFITQILKMGKK
jgi:hypothetical protein